MDRKECIFVLKSLQSRYAISAYLDINGEIIKYSKQVEALTYAIKVLEDNKCKHEALPHLVCIKCGKLVDDKFKESEE